MNILKVLIEFCITFIIVYAFYYFFIIKKCKKNKKMAPAEVNIIIALYKIDVKKINLMQMIRVVSIVTTLIISIIITIISVYFDSTLIILIFGTIISVLLAIICYRFIGRHYEKVSNKKEVSKK